MFRAIYGLGHKFTLSCYTYFTQVNQSFEFFMLLPKDVQILILSELPLKDFKNIARVSKGFYKLTHSTEFWYPKIYRDFPDAKGSIENGINKPTLPFYISKMRADHPKLYSYYKKIYYSISDNNLAAIKQNVNCTFYFISNIYRTFKDPGFTPVQFAARLKRYEILDYFFNSIIRPHFNGLLRDQDGINLLGWAMRCLQPVRVIEDIRKESGISIYDMSRSKASMLLEAVLYGHTAAIKYYCDMGYSVNQKQERTETTFLYYAAQEGLTDVLKTLIEHGAEINAVSGDDQATPLIAVIEYGHFDCFKTLLDHGADINIPRTPVDTKERITYGPPLTIAARYGYYRMVELLLARTSVDLDALGGVQNQYEHLRADELAEKFNFPEVATMIRTARSCRDNRHCK